MLAQALRHIYFDQLSGAKAAKERPGLTALLAYARREDTVLVYRMDRMGRSLIDVLNTAAEMQERGIGLRSLVDGIDASSASVLRRSSRCLNTGNDVRIESTRNTAIWSPRTQATFPGRDRDQIHSL